MKREYTTEQLIRRHRLAARTLLHKHRKKLDEPSLYERTKMAAGHVRRAAALSGMKVRDVMNEIGIPKDRQHLVLLRLNDR